MEKITKLKLSRDANRLTSRGLIDYLFDDFIELHGDRCYGDDQAVITGICTLNNEPLTVIAQEKGVELNEKIKRNFAMSHPEGYRKIVRQAKLAEKFNRPIICIIDTAGAYPGIGSEERGQGSAIAECLFTFADLKVPVISIILSEGGSGGALAIGISDYIYGFENCYYSVISPEGYAEILYKGTKTVEECLEELPIFADDLLNLKIIDEIIKEPVGGVDTNIEISYILQLRERIFNKLNELKQIDNKKLLKARYDRYRQFGEL